MIDEHNGEPLLRNYLEPGYRQNLIEKQEGIDQAHKSIIDRRIVSEQDGSSVSDSVFGVVVLRNLRFRLTASVKPPRLCGGADKTNGAGQYCPSEGVFAVYEKIVAEAKRCVNSWGGKLYFVYLPTSTRYNYFQGPCGLQGTNIYHHDDVLSVMKKLGVPVIDVTEASDNLPDSRSLWPFGLDGHYSEVGYEVVARTVLDSIDFNN